MNDKPLQMHLLELRITISSYGCMLGMFCSYNEVVIVIMLLYNYNCSVEGSWL